MDGKKQYQEEAYRERNANILSSCGSGFSVGLFAYGVATNNPPLLSLGAGLSATFLLFSFHSYGLQMLYNKLAAEATPSDPQKKQAFISKAPEPKA